MKRILLVFIGLVMVFLVIPLTLWNFGLFPMIRLTVEHEGPPNLALFDLIRARPTEAEVRALLDQCPTCLHVEYPGEGNAACFPDTWDQPALLRLLLAEGLSIEEAHEINVLGLVTPLQAAATMRRPDIVEILGAEAVRRGVPRSYFADAKVNPRNDVSIHINALLNQFIDQTISGDNH